jgi:hypothetical protein
MIHCFVKGFFIAVFFGDRAPFSIGFFGFSGSSASEDGSLMGFRRTLQAGASERAVQAPDIKAEKPGFSHLFMTKTAPEWFFPVFWPRWPCPKD